MTRASTSVLACLGITLSLVVASTALAWDAHGHRTVTLLAMDTFAKSVKPDDKPTELDWLLTADSRAQAAYQSGEPDRYRAIRANQLKHVNDPDHYIDIEDLEQFGLTLSTIPPLRYEYLRAMAIAKHEHPEMIVMPYNEKRDFARTQEFPGYLPFSITEHYGKLVSSFRQIRVLNSLNDPARAPQLAAAKSNVIYEMGQLSHFVGDAAQPLHTTRHHHGWVGLENPNGYTTNNGFHSYIDGTILGIHALSYDTLKGTCAVERVVDQNDPFNDVIAHIQRSFDQMRPLYDLQKSGDLEKDPGKAFISERLCDGGAMLGALYLAAWNASAMAPKDAQDFIRYDQDSDGKTNPMEPKKPAQPAPETPAPDAPKP